MSEKEADIKWLHSNGPNNDDPRLDLGGAVSVVELSDTTMNNLFDNVKPDWITNTQYVDYRCFYIYNLRTQEVIVNAQLSFIDQTGCSEAWYGTKLQNEQQYIIISGIPDSGGYVILEVPVFGFPVTCYYNDSWTSFANEIQLRLREATYCEGITVTLDDTFTSGARLLVNYDGSLKNHKLNLLNLIQNHLVFGGTYEYRALAKPGCNTTTSSCVNVSKPINEHIPATGNIWLFDVSNDIYVEKQYDSFSGQEFTLSDTIGFNLVDGDEIWIESQQEVVTMEITRKQEGWPIDQLAFPIERVTDLPDFVPTTSVINVGLLLPKEGFFVWCKRSTDPGTAGCKDGFTIVLSGESYIWG
jgi:hypothetical protein